MLRTSLSTHRLLFSSSAGFNRTAVFDSKMQSRGPITNQSTMMRGFATSTKGKAADGGTDDSIFASADYFKEAQDLQKDVQADLTEAASSTKETLSELPWMDMNDTLGASMSILPKDLGNLVQGV